MSKCAVCDGPNSFRCGRCAGRVYCGAECQRADWPRHKIFCDPRVGALAALGRFLAIARREVQFRNYAEALTRIVDCKRGLLVAALTPACIQRQLQTLEKGELQQPTTEGHNYLFTYFDAESEFFQDAQRRGGAKPGDVVLIVRGGDERAVVVATVLEPWWSDKPSNDTVADLSREMDLLTRDIPSILTGLTMAVGDTLKELQVGDSVTLRGVRIAEWFRFDS